MPFIFGRFSEQSRRAEHGLLYLHGDWFTSLVSYRPNTYQPYTVDDRSLPIRGATSSMTEAKAALNTHRVELEKQTPHYLTSKPFAHGSSLPPFPSLHCSSPSHCACTSLSLGPYLRFHGLAQQQ